MPSAWTLVLVWALRLVGVGLFVIGLAGIPDDLRTWSTLLEGLPEAQLRLSLVMVAAVVVAATLPWRQWLIRSHDMKGVAVDQRKSVSSQAIQGGPGAIAIQAGRDIVVGRVEEDDEGVRDRVFRKMESASIDAQTAVTVEAMEAAKGRFLLATGELESASRKWPQGQAIRALTTELSELVQRNAVEFVRPSFQQRMSDLKRVLADRDRQEPDGR